jgi:hypothetical protein
MATKKTKLTPLQQAYNKELQRIMSGVKKAEKQGKIVDTTKLPTTPKRVTKQSIEKIKKIKPSDLVTKRDTITTNSGYTVDTSTGEIISKSEPKHDREKFNQKHKLDAYKQEPQQNFPKFNDLVISNFQGYIKGFPKNISEKIDNWLDRLIKTAGPDRVAEMLESSSARLGDYLSRAGYDSDGAVLEYCTDMLNYYQK